MAQSNPVYRRITEHDKFIFDAAGNLTGIQNPNANGADLDATGFASLSTGAGIPGVYGITSTNLARAQAAFQKTMNGTAGGQAAFNSVIAIIGDSTERNTAGGVVAGSLNGGAAAAPARVMAKALRDVGITAYNNSSFGNASFSVMTAANFMTYEPAMVITGTTNSNNIGGTIMLGGNSWNLTATCKFAYTPPEQQCDTFDIYMLQNAGFGHVTVDINGVTPLDIDLAGGTTTFLKTTVTAALGANTCNVNWVSGANNFLNAFVGRNSAVPEISIFNLAIGSSNSSHWVHSTLYYEAFNCIAAIAPHLTFIELGINDYKTVAGGSPLTPIPTYISNLSTLIDKCLVSGDVVGITPNPIATVLGTLPTSFSLQQSYVDAAISVFIAKGIPYIDNFARFQSYEVSSAAPYSRYQAGEYVHPNAWGERFKALPMFRLVAWLLGR